MKKVLLTGGTGFLGSWLLKELIDNNVLVYVISRRNSTRRDRLSHFSNVKIIEQDMDEISSLPDMLGDTCDVCYHLAWEGGRNDIYTQAKNITDTVNTVHAAKKIGCKRVIITGSQAEYGLHTQRITEESSTRPITAYGASKLSACHLTRVMAKQIGIGWTWVRVFSLYGPYDHPNTMISYSVREYASGRAPKFTDADQYWDYLHVTDAAKALFQLGVTNPPDTVYNLAYGHCAPLSEYIKIIHELAAPTIPLEFGGHSSVESVVNLNASIDKITAEIEWLPRVEFSEGIKELIQNVKIQEAML